MQLQSLFTFVKLQNVSTKKRKFYVGTVIDGYGPLAFEV